MPAAENRIPANDRIPLGDPSSVVLVVEDQILVRMTVADYLRECGFSVIEAAHAGEALTLFRAGITIDVVFSDVQMPGDMDGIGLARWLRNNRPEVQVILTSGVGQAGEAAGDLCASSPLMAKP
jgi:CheY-like chemotaxis protein